MQISETHCFGISMTVNSCIPGRQIRDGGITSSGGDWGNSYPEAQDPRQKNCRTQIFVLFGMIHVGGVFKQKKLVLSVYPHIYLRLQNKPLFIWYIYIKYPKHIRWCFRFLKELYYPNFILR